MRTTKLLNQDVVCLDGFRDGRVDAGQGSAGQELEELAVLVNRAADVGHDFRTDSALGWSNILDIVFNGFFEYETPGLAVIFRQPGEMLIKLGIHFQANLPCRCLRHLQAPPKQT